jgi:ribulose-5-phosphate 4-epimerase/fuculose-1-phosphate aldolase
MERIIAGIEDSSAESVPGSQIIGAAIDVGMVVAGLAIFVGIFVLAGGALKPSLGVPLFGSVFAVFALFYWFLCTLPNHGSPGMQFVGRGTLDPPAAPAERLRLSLTASPRILPARPLIEDLVLANRILATEELAEVYGNVSFREPLHPNRFFLARPIPPHRVTAGDIYEYDIDGAPIANDPSGENQDRLIHSEIYKARPDVMAIVCWRSADILPFTASTVALLPITQTALFLGDDVPIFKWSNSDAKALGTRSTARELAVTLGEKTAALMRGHGALVVANSLHAAMARAYYTNLNARLQAQAILLGGNVRYLDAQAPRSAPAQDDFEQTWECWKEKLRS